MIWLGVALAGTHLRAVAVQPTALDELGERPVRVWWNGEPAPLELGDGRTFRRTDPLEPGALVPWSEQVRLGGEVVQPVTGLDPGGVARLFAPDALPGREVSDIVATERGAWAALLDGGLVWLDKSHLAVRAFGMAEGLPTAQVNAVEVFRGSLHAGTGEGLYREDGHVWGEDEGLPDRWVQALHASEEALMVGTYRGLAVLREGLRTVLGPHSVFWVGPGSDQRLWAGYHGLQGLPMGEPIEGVDPSLNVWDVEHSGDTHLLATDSEGLLALRSGLLSPVYSPPSGAVFALEQLRGQVWVAADDGGLVTLADGQPVRRWGPADGLPGRRVYEVVGGPPGKLWVGTDDGLALMWPEHEVVVSWPRSPVAAGVPALDMLGDEHFLLAATDEGVAGLGRVPRGWRDAEALPGPIVALESEGRVLWVVGRDHLWRLERGRVSGWSLPVPVTDAALVSGNLWMGSPEGLFRFDAGLESVVPGPRCGPVRRLVSSPDGLLWVAAEHRVLSVARNGDHQDYLGTSPPLDLAPHEGMVLVATPYGLEVLDPRTAEVSTVPAFEDPILALASHDGLVWALSADLRLRSVGSALPRAGMPELWTVGAVRGLRVDGHGRLWLLGERGFALL